MKTIALILAAGSALALGACSQKTENNATATFDSASSDLGNAADHAAARVDTATDNLGAKTDATLDRAGDHVANAAGKAERWTGNALQATGEAIHNAGSEVKK